MERTAVNLAGGLGKEIEMTEETEEVVTQTEMYNHLVDLGITPTDARTALDLAAHAKEQAIEAMQRVSRTAPLHLRTLVTALSIDTLSAGLEQPDVKKNHAALMVQSMVIAALYGKAQAAAEEGKPN